jgi:hypothetical protein
MEEAEQCDHNEELEIMVEWYRVEYPHIDSSKCCFDAVEWNQSTSCSNTNSSHRFCFGCTKLNAETEIGKGKQNPSLTTLTLDPPSSVWIRRDVFLYSQTLNSTVS